MREVDGRILAPVFFQPLPEPLPRASSHVVPTMGTFNDVNQKHQSTDEYTRAWLYAHAHTFNLRAFIPYRVRTSYRRGTYRTTSVSSFFFQFVRPSFGLFIVRFITVSFEKKNLPLDFVSPSKPLQIVQESAARLRQCPVTTLQVCQNAAHFLPLGIEEVGLRDVP